MQAPGSLMLVATFVFAIALAIGLAVGLAAPILAVPFFLVGFGAFLAWRGKRRADATFRGRYGGHVPSTEEAAADPAGDSGVVEATASGADHRQRADAQGT
jgi:hypothetical protein